MVYITHEKEPRAIKQSFAKEAEGFQAWLIQPLAWEELFCD